MKKSIIIVGGTGFLGHNLAKKCLKIGWNVFSISRNKPKKIKKLKKVNYIFFDISNKKDLKLKLKNLLNVDYIVNFGGEVNHKNFKRTYLSHYIGAKNLSDFYLKTKIKKFVQIGSSLEYGNSRSPQKESVFCKPKSNYALAKHQATKYLIKLFKNKGFPAIILRPYQIYGPFQEPNRFISYIILSCIKNKYFPCSSGKQKRDFLYIDDFLELIFKILKSNKSNGNIFNAGYGKATQLNNIIKYVNKKIKLGKPLYGKIKLRNEENLVTFPCMKKTRQVLKWKPKVKLFDGIIKTINFMEGKK